MLIRPLAQNPIKVVLIKTVFVQLFLLTVTIVLQSVENTDGLVISVGYWLIFLALLPAILLALLRKGKYILSSIVSFNIAPIWFLYLESVLPGYDAYEHTPAYRKLETYIVILFFIVCVNIGYLILIRPIGGLFARKISFISGLVIENTFFYNITIICFLLPIISFWIYYGSIEIVWKAMTAGRSGGGGSGLLIRNEKGGDSSLLIPITWLWQLVPLVGTIYLTRAQKLFQPVSLIPFLLLSVVVISYFLGGSRGEMMSVIGAPIFIILHQKWNLGLRVFLPITIVFGLLIGIMELQVRFRGNLIDVLLNTEKAVVNSGYSSITSFDITKTHRDNNFYLLSLLVNTYANEVEFEGFNTYYAIILNPIPRTIWPGKPIIGGAVGGVENQKKFVLKGPLIMGTTSLTTSVVGLGYMSSGYWGLVVVAFTYVVILLFFDSSILLTSEKNVFKSSIIGAGVFLGFWGFRSFLALIIAIYPVLIYIIILRLLSKR